MDPQHFLRIWVLHLTMIGDPVDPNQGILSQENKFIVLLYGYPCHFQQDQAVFQKSTVCSYHEKKIKKKFTKLMILSESIPKSKPFS